MVLLRESPSDFAAITEDFIASLPAKKTQWIHEILDGRKEQDRILIKTDTFVAVMQPTWKNVNDSANMSYLILVHAQKDELRSLRDVDGSHIPMLEDMEKRCYDAMEIRHGKTRAEIKAFFHYQPSFYHLHVHFRALSAEADPSGLTTREHPLETVIDNLKIDPMYYKKATLAFSSSSQPKLSSRFFRARGGKKALIIDASCVFKDDAGNERTHGNSFLRFCVDNFRTMLHIDVPGTRINDDLQGRLAYCDSDIEESFRDENTVHVTLEGKHADAKAQLQVPALRQEDALAPWGKAQKLLWSWAHAERVSAAVFAQLRFGEVLLS